jgi:hypothetical protein
MTLPSAGPVSTIDWIGLATFGLLVAGQITVWIVGAVRGRRAAVHRGEERASAAAAENAAVKQVAGALEKIAAEFATQNDRYRSHELDCAAWRATTDQILKELSGSFNRMVTNQENLQAQLLNLARGAAPQSEAQHVPANIRSARAARR